MGGTRKTGEVQVAVRYVATPDLLWGIGEARRAVRYLFWHGTLHWVWVWIVCAVKLGTYSTYGIDETFSVRCSVTGASSSGRFLCLQGTVLL